MRYAFSHHIFSSFAKHEKNPHDAPFHRIMRAAHVVKGAASNLMCSQLRTAAMHLETAASRAHEAGGLTSPQPLQVAVQAAYLGLKQAAHSYAAFLQSIGIA
jgi:HPt (histidine-containing phosphotransfer) domain-containing protein